MILSTRMQPIVRTASARISGLGSCESCRAPQALSNRQVIKHTAAHRRLHTPTPVFASNMEAVKAAPGLAQAGCAGATFPATEGRPAP